MKSKTDELLYILLWGCNMLMRPTFRNLTDSFESWSYSKGLHWQLARLEHQHLIESQGQSPNDRSYRLTETGVLQSLGGRNPEDCWRRTWDGKWRLVLFDYPRSKDVARDRLRRYLRRRGFGYLQHSVWISPNPLTQERDTLAGGTVNVGALVILEARPASGETDEEIVAGAWDFDLINERYENYLAVLDDCAQDALKGTAGPEALKRWCQRERVSWLEAVTMDPLLPEVLLPASYLGKRAWKARIKALQPVAARIRQFELGSATERG